MLFPKLAYDKKGYSKHFLKSGKLQKYSLKFSFWISIFKIVFLHWQINVVKQFSSILF